MLGIVFVGGGKIEMLNVESAFMGAGAKEQDPNPFLLTGRDQEILSFIYEQGLITVDQLGEFFCPDSSERNTRRLELRLRRAGLIQRSRIHLGESLLCLTPTGVRVAKKHSEFEFNYRPHELISNLEHHLAVNEIRVLVGFAFPDTQWVPESFLKKTTQGPVPDGALKLTKNAPLVHFEFERTLKSRSRYQESTQRFLSPFFQTPTIYVAGSDHVARGLLTFLPRNPRLVIETFHRMKMYSGLIQRSVFQVLGSDPI